MKAVDVPDFVPPLTPVSYAVTQTVKGYSYQKVVGSRLVKRRGKKRRVRVPVVSLIEVPSRRVHVWITQYPDVRIRWYNVQDYQRGIEDGKNVEGHDVGDVEMEIFHSDPDRDVIHAVEELRRGRVFYWGEPTLFVWKTTRLPSTLKLLNVKSKFIASHPFRMVRIWFWVFHTEKREYRLWCRSSIVNQSDFSQAQEFAFSLYEQVTEDLEEQFTYLECRGLVAWTAYTLGERARRRDSRATKIGGT